MTNELTPEEEERLARRAAAIWGDPFSPEAMAQDAIAKGPEKAYNDVRRYRRMEDLEEENTT
jgi:hypothetical protein